MTRFVPMLLAIGLSAAFSCGCRGDALRADWMKGAKYGVAIPFVNCGGPTWNERVDAFDVETLADQIRDSGAGYVIFPLGQSDGYYCSPNAAFDRYMGVKPGELCSRRDLPADMAKALAKRGIRMLLYLPARSPQSHKDALEKFADIWYGHAAPQEFQRRWEEVIREWSLRYGRKVSGWWFDGAYNTPGYDDLAQPHNWNTWAAACRAGNPDSVLAFNLGAGLHLAFRQLTPQQDYTAGEMNDWDATPEQYPAPKGVQWHLLTFVGSNWGKCDGPRKQDDWMIDYIRTVNRQGGIVTLDVGLKPDDGTIYPPHLKQLLAIGKAAKRGL